MSAFIQPIKDKNIENIERMKKLNRVDGHLSKIYMTFSLLAGAFYCVKPFVSNLVLFMKSQDDYTYDHMLPLESPYIFNTSKSPAYELSFILNCLGFYICPIMSVRTFYCFLKLFFSLQHILF